MTSRENHFFNNRTECDSMDKKRSRPDPEVRAYEYELPGGWKVLAGKTDEDNDTLSIRLAHPEDWWFHVRGMPGSHVLLWHRPDELDHKTLKCAAAIAAYHSKARDGGMVSVSCTRAKNVTKPRGAKPGTVTIRRESLLEGPPVDSGRITERSKKQESDYSHERQLDCCGAGAF